VGADDRDPSGHLVALGDHVLDRDPNIGERCQELGGVLGEFLQELLATNSESASASYAFQTRSTSSRTSSLFASLIRASPPDV